LKSLLEKIFWSEKELCADIAEEKGIDYEIYKKISPEYFKAEELDELLFKGGRKRFELLISRETYNSFNLLCKDMEEELREEKEEKEKIKKNEFLKKIWEIKKECNIKKAYRIFVLNIIFLIGGNLLIQILFYVFDLRY
jgi:hypothetical protein